jgi:hypothetical protein
MCTIDELDEKLDAFIEATDKRINQVEKRIKTVERTNKNLDGMLMNHVEATLMYVRSMDDKVNRIMELLESQTGDYTGD